MAVTNTKVSNIENVLLSEIEVEPKFNARSNVETSVGGSDDDDKGGFAGFRNSIMVEGQDTPVILRRQPKGAKKPYFLCAGFRRHEAIRQIAEEKGTKNPTIKAEIRDLTDEQARMVNMRENTARDDLGGPDLCFGIGQILNANKTLSSVKISEALGMNQSYVNKMMRFWKGIKKSILADWRENPVRLTNQQMLDVLELRDADGKVTGNRPENEQQAVYDALLKSKTSEKEKPAANPDKWVDGAVSAATAVGAMLGRLSRDGHIRILGENFFGDAVRTLVKFKSDATAAQVQKIADAAHKGFDDGETAEETEKEKGEAAKAEPKKGGAKKKVSAAPSAN